MRGKAIHHQLSGITGVVDSTAEHPDGAVVVRVDDHWLFLEDCEII